MDSWGKVHVKRNEGGTVANTVGKSAGKVVGGAQQPNKTPKTASWAQEVGRRVSPRRKKWSKTKSAPQGGGISVTRGGESEHM